MRINPKKGTETIEQDGALWLVSCGVHLGESPIGVETRIDSATGNPREVAHEVDGEVEMIVVEFPTYGERVGFQPDCAGCQAVVLETQLHIMAVEADRMQADFEFERETQRRAGAVA